SACLLNAGSFLPRRATWWRLIFRKGKRRSDLVSRPFPRSISTTRLSLWFLITPRLRAAEQAHLREAAHRSDQCSGHSARTFATIQGRNCFDVECSCFEER